MRADGRDFIVLFFNPNIFPRVEYDRRLAEQIQFCEKLGVEYAVGNYDHDVWRGCIRRFEQGPERGQRCAACFHHRAEFGIKWAAGHGYGAITSVFGVSPHKDQSQVDEAFRNAIRDSKFTDRILYADIKFDYAPERGMYRQKYCGCEFSETYHGE
jgi:predicted adenine nucleotide alpha hydrolase (AANH) superfamily ATPase